MLSINYVLSLFILLTLTSAIYFISKRTKLPYTVLLVLVGLLLVPITNIPLLNPVLGFLTETVLTPELLFYIFLPILIFESAFNMSTRKMIDNIWSISLLSVAGLIVSASLIAIGLFFILPILGLNVPFIAVLLFGAIISSTDPVAVLALFKEFGAPKRLTMIFEGESLFNDGTAVALFLVVLSIAERGFHGGATIFEGIAMFMMMVILGIIFGIAMAIIFTRILKKTRTNEFVSINVLIISAHLVFILCELINATPIFGVHIHISSIIATTISSLFLGNYARHSLPPKIDSYLNKSVEHLAFVANSLVFLLAGILFASTNIDMSRLFWPIIATILVVATARAISVFAVIKPLNKFKLEAEIPLTWQKLLAWGSLRGALAIIVVLLIPDSLKIDGWAYSFSIKELILSLTIGCILATLFIKALTIGPMIEKMKINLPTPFKRAYSNDFGLYHLLTEKYRLSEQLKKGYIQKKHYDEISQKIEDMINKSLEVRKEMTAEFGKKLCEQTTRYAAINIEKHFLKALYENNEVEEIIYRKINGKLRLQLEKIEYGKFEEINPSTYIDRKDIFDRLASFIQFSIFKSSTSDMPIQKYQYYRAQAIISRKVIKIMSGMQNQYDRPVFDIKAYENLIKIYRQYKKMNEEKMEQIYSNNENDLSDYIKILSVKTLEATSNKSFNFLSSRELIDEDILQNIELNYSIK